MREAAVREVAAGAGGGEGETEAEILPAPSPEPPVAGVQAQLQPLSAPAPSRGVRSAFDVPNLASKRRTRSRSEIVITSATMAMTGKARPARTGWPAIEIEHRSRVAQNRRSGLYGTAVPNESFKLA